MQKTAPKERAEQIELHNLINVLKLKYPNIIANFAIPNGGSRNVIEAANLKREGVTAGVPDYLVIFVHFVLFIEMKRRVKSLSRVTKEQTQMIETLEQSDCVFARVAYGAKEASALVLYFLKLDLLKGKFLEAMNKESAPAHDLA